MQKYNIVFKDVQKSGYQLSNAQLLIIDNDNENIPVLNRLLKNDYNTTCASSVDDLKYLLSRHQYPDLVILDPFKCAGDGLDVCRTLKENPHTAYIPVVLIANRHDPNDEIKALSLGAVDFIIKPFSLSVIKARINSHLAAKYRADLLEQLSNIDPLTRIPNRRRFDNTLELEWRRAIRGSSYIAILMIDLDGFKVYNDMYGHSSGDEYLKKVAHCLSGLLRRPGDIVARYGGEEFVVLLPECNLQSAFKIAERIRSAVEHLSRQNKEIGQKNLVTASIGCAAMKAIINQSAKKLIVKADEKLYKAKSLGKNRVCCGDDVLDRVSQNNAI
ncbi:MAG: diguanylate cyclase [Candidatus Thiodiazotropha endolucinida]